MASTNTIEIVDYDPRWPALFELEYGVINEAFGDRALEIQHVGSTAVPGLASRPIIDISVVVEDLDDPDSYDARLETIGYQPEASNQDDVGLLYSKVDPPQAYNLHIVKRGGRAYLRHHLLQDYLRERPETAREYENLKFRLARTASDLAAYNQSKAEFVDDIIHHSAKSAGIPYPPNE